MKGALVSFMPTIVGSLPNVIVFQFNPETITHSWSAATWSGQGGKAKPAADPMAVDTVPGESFSFKLSLDANESIAGTDSNPVSAALATVSGVYTRLAALEMLMYPSGASGVSGLLGKVAASVGPS